MVAHPIVSRPFPRGRNAQGEEIILLTWRDLEFFSQIHVWGEWYRTFCPVHRSGQERSLAIKTTTGFGHCFGCEARVFVSEFDPLLARRLQRQWYQVPHQGASRLFTTSHKKEPCVVREAQVLCEPSTQEWQQLADLQAQGALSLDHETAWNGQAYLEARHISLEVARRVGVTYVASGAAQEYGEWIRPWEDHLLFPLLTPDGEVGFIGRLLTDWQSCCDAAAHQARLRAEKLEPWRKTGRPGWFWDPSHLPSQDPVVLVDGPFDRLALLAAGDFQPGEVIALTGMPFQSAWLARVRAILFALNQAQSSKEASERVKHHLAWNGGVRVEVCRSLRRSNWSERWRQEGHGGLELLYVHHALLMHGL